MIRLHIISDALNGLAFDLAADRVTIGRAADNTICLEHLTVSKHHAIVTMHGTDFTLQDLNSTNGTILNGNSVTSVQLKDGDHIFLGAVELRLTVNESAPLPSSSVFPVANRNKEVTVRLKPSAPSGPIEIKKPVPLPLKESPPAAAQRPPSDPLHALPKSDSPRKVTGTSFSVCLAAIGILLLTIGYTGQSDAMKFLGLAGLLLGLISSFFFFRFGSLIAPRKKRK
jgi:pSer/pThr/pTyr-binding forkhead associated (FHA) protein